MDLWHAWEAPLVRRQATTWPEDLGTWGPDLRTRRSVITRHSLGHSHHVPDDHPGHGLLSQDLFFEIPLSMFCPLLSVYTFTTVKSLLVSEHRSLYSLDLIEASRGSGAWSHANYHGGRFELSAIEYVI